METVGLILIGLSGLGMFVYGTFQLIEEMIEYAKDRDFLSMITPILIFLVLIGIGFYIFGNMVRQ